MSCPNLNLFQYYSFKDLFVRLGLIYLTTIKFLTYLQYYIFISLTPTIGRPNKPSTGKVLFIKHFQVPFALINGG